MLCCSSLLFLRLVVRPLCNCGRPDDACRSGSVLCRCSGTDRYTTLAERIKLLEVELCTAKAASNHTLAMYYFVCAYALVCLCTGRFVLACNGMDVNYAAVPTPRRCLEFRAVLLYSLL